jgi:hypothetical protein
MHSFDILYVQNICQEVFVDKITNVTAIEKSINQSIRMNGLPAAVGGGSNSSADEGHFLWSQGCSLDKSTEFPKWRYSGKRLLGSGTYCNVVECIDQKYKARTAVN